MWDTFFKIRQSMKDRGMSKEPDTNFVLPDVEEEQKQAELIYQSEKLTIAYGILCMPKGTPIQIMKNL
ncbi:pentatricopeptide repeat-containing protein [Quercus suber]|uniref:Pentatricopeptide repeat-containing protein n=1 Tax=Quercus suber TaxID=58331 RepID=A0AAW0M425_QUESU